MENEKLKSLQEKHQTLRVEPFEVVDIDNGCLILFRYCLDPQIKFKTEYFIPNLKIKSDQQSAKLLNYLSIVESFSYWKLSCPANIILENTILNTKEEEFFCKLLTKGMGEFLYRNNLPLNPKIKFSSLGPKSPQIKSDSNQNKGSLVLIGGGKDSVVSMEILKQMNPESDIYPIIPFCINPIRASLDCISVSGLQNSILCERKIDPKIFELSQSGYFNGHIPFSSVLSLISSLMANQMGLKYVISSNESSANQGNVEVGDIVVNHQYSKSFEYEQDLVKLYEDSSIPVRYFSLLRPLNEIQISKIFSQNTKYHQVFQSCNVRQTLSERKLRENLSEYSPFDRWCGQCPKCVFVYLILNLFLTQEQLKSIFGVLPCEYEGFKKYVDELSGISNVKPFECVGTFEEVRLAVEKHFHANAFLEESLQSFLNEWDSQNFLDSKMEKVIKVLLEKSNCR